MATILTHAVVAASLAKAAAPEPAPKRFWALAILCAVLPDADVIGFRFGIRYADVLGHRGFLHSLTFALLLGIIVTVTAFPSVRRFSGRWWMLAGFFALATASHAVLDAMTDGGYGVAFFSPFDRSRYFFPWQPLRVSPIGMQGFLTARGMLVLKSEFLWIWAPGVVMFLAIRMSRAEHMRRRALSKSRPD